MTLETNLYSQAATGLVSLFGGSILLLGLVMFVAIAIIFHKLQIGFSSSVAITTVIMGLLSMTVDTSNYGGTELPVSIFNIGFSLIAFGMAFMIASAILKR